MAKACLRVQQPLDGGVLAGIFATAFPNNQASPMEPVAATCFDHVVASMNLNISGRATCAQLDCCTCISRIPFMLHGQVNMQDDVTSIMISAA